MADFKFIRFHNLLSTGEEWITIPLNSAATTLIVGKNGMGKSQFIDAISFALFNKAFRRINKAQLINSITGKNLEVQLAFEKAGHEYLICRGIKPNYIRISQDGVPLQNLDDPEAYIERVLGMNQKSFFQIVVLGSALYTPFMQLKVPERRLVVEDLLDLQVYATMAQILKGRIGELEEERQSSRSLLAQARIRVEEEERHLKAMQADTAGMINDKQKSIILEEAKIIMYEKQIVDFMEREINLKGRMQDEKEVSDTIRKLDALDVQIKSQLHNLNMEIEFFNGHASCPTCKQSINEIFRSNMLVDKKRKQKELMGGRQQLGSKVVKLRDRQLEINDIKNQLLTVANDIVQSKHLIYTGQTIIKKIREEIDKLEAKSEANVELLERYKTDFERYDAQVNTLTNQRAVMDAAAELLKDQGVRAQVIKKYLPVLNKLINHYLAQMEFMCHLELDEGFNETIKSRFRDAFSYDSFSEGEKIRIDLSVLFAWRALTKLRNSSSANLLVFDEVLDSSLDQDGADEFLKIVNDLTENENVMVISHRGDQLVDKFKDVIRFDKSRGFSVASRG